MPHGGVVRHSRSWDFMPDNALSIILTLAVGSQLASSVIQHITSPGDAQYFPSAMAALRSRIARIAVQETFTR
jgi:hypothetical protein